MVDFIKDVLETRAPNHYDILGLKLFESDRKTIHDAGLKQTGKLKEWDIARDEKTAQKARELQEQVSAAITVLEDAEKKAEYDKQLSEELGIPLPQAHTEGSDKSIIPQDTETFKDADTRLRNIMLGCAVIGLISFAVFIIIGGVILSSTSEKDTPIESPPKPKKLTKPKKKIAPPVPPEKPKIKTEKQSTDDNSSEEKKVKKSNPSTVKTAKIGLPKKKKAEKLDEKLNIKPEQNTEQKPKEKTKKTGIKTSSIFYELPAKKESGKTQKTSGSKDISSDEELKQKLPDHMLEFDGSNSWVEIPILPEVAGREPITVDIWCITGRRKSRDWTSLLWIGNHKYRTEGRIITLWCHNKDDFIHCSIGTNYGEHISVNSPHSSIDRGRLQHIRVCIVPGGDMFINIDGEEVARLKTIDRMKKPTYITYLGWNPVYNHKYDHWTGKIIAFKISKGIQAMKKLFSPDSLQVDENTLVAYSFTAGSGNTVKDLSGHAKNAKLHKCEWVDGLRKILIDRFDKNIEKAESYLLEKKYRKALEYAKRAKVFLPKSKTPDTIIKPIISYALDLISKKDYDQAFPILWTLQKVVPENTEIVDYYERLTRMYKNSVPKDKRKAFKIIDGVPCLYLAEIPRKLHDDIRIFNNHAYLFVKKSYNWKRARDYCRKLDGHLATVENKEENDFLKSKIRYNGHWLGGKIEKTDKKYKGYWLGGDKWSYSRWDYGEPDGDSYYDYNKRKYIYKPTYVYIYYGKWHDTQDSDSMYFICEWDTVSTPLSVNNAEITKGLKKLLKKRLVTARKLMDSGQFRKAYDIVENVVDTIPMDDDAWKLEKALKSKLK